MTAFGILFAYLGLCLLPTAAFALLIRGLDAWTRWAGVPLIRRSARRRAARRRADAERRERCARCSRNLRRLAAEHDRLVAGSDPAALGFRLRAIETAYDDTLREACRVLDIDAPPVPLDPVGRIQAEADLVTHGLSW